MASITEHDHRLAERVLFRTGLTISVIDINLLRHKASLLRLRFEYKTNGCTRSKLPFETYEEYDEQRKIQMDINGALIARTIASIEFICQRANVPFYIQKDCRGPSLYLGTNSDALYLTLGVAID